MLDNPVPHSPSTAITPAAAAPRDPGTMGPSPRTPRAPSLSEVVLARLQHLGVSMALLALIWVVALIILFLIGQRSRDALGFATVIAVVSWFFVRSFLPAPATRAQPAVQAASHPTDSVREVIETVVFVVVLVLLLRSFAAEAFVIPTGSMATTLWGYQKVVHCPQCDFEFPVNCSNEIDPPEGSSPTRVTGCTCPNCRLNIALAADAKELKPASGSILDPKWHSGDRVLVAKFVYDLFRRLPDRLDVVVFKFPGDDNKVPFPATGPVKKHVQINYIKRLIGRPGETIAVHRGKLFVLPTERGLTYDDVALADDDLGKKTQLWRLPHTHHNDDKAVSLFKGNQFEIIRKKPENLLAMRRIVYDNDHPAKDLTAPGYQRWRPAEKTAWSAQGQTAFEHDGAGKDFEWLRYRHILRGSPDKPQLITDFVGYNSGTPKPLGEDPGPGNWVADLMVECQVNVVEAKGSFALELSRGAERYQALFNLDDGACSLYRLAEKKKDEGRKPELLQTAQTSLKGKGTYHVRFANVDDRLTLWVDESLPFGDGVDTDASDRPVPLALVPTTANDLDPVSVGSRGARVAVSKLKIYRDTYYTTATGNDSPAQVDNRDFKPDDPETWTALEKIDPSTYYVQPGHFLCLGDNSPQSSDGRSWGLVPQRLLLGRALLVYFPFSRAGRIR